MKMKKLISTILATVMVMGCMATPVFAAGKVVYPLSEAPKMEHTKTIGPVTFSNYLEHKDNPDSKDFNGKPIHVYSIYVGMGACAASNNTKSEFVYHLGNFNCASNNQYEYQIGTGMNFKRAAHFANTGFETLCVKAYVGKEIGNNVYDKQVWEFVDDPQYIEIMNDGGGYWKTYSFVAYDDSHNPWYYLVTVMDRTDYKGDGGSVTTPTTPAPSNPSPTPTKPEAPTTTPTNPETTGPAKTAVANPTTSKIFVNGKEVAFDAYNINGNNYFKLRDVAITVRKTPKQFEVKWDPSMTYTDENGQKARGGIALYSNKSYTTVGGEMKKGDGIAKNCVLTTSPITKDGKSVQFTAYNINGNNYFKLRDLGEAFDFDVTWDSKLKAVVVDTSSSYTED